MSWVAYHAVDGVIHIKKITLSKALDDVIKSQGTKGLIVNKAFAEKLGATIYMFSHFGIKSKIPYLIPVPQLSTEQG